MKPALMYLLKDPATTSVTLGCDARLFTDEQKRLLKTVDKFIANDFKKELSFLYYLSEEEEPMTEEHFQELLGQLSYTAPYVARVARLETVIPESPVNQRISDLLRDRIEETHCYIDTDIMRFAVIRDAFLDDVSSAQLLRNETSTAPSFIFPATRMFSVSDILFIPTGANAYRNLQQEMEINSLVRMFTISDYVRHHARDYKLAPMKAQVAQYQRTLAPNQGMLPALLNELEDGHGKIDELTPLQALLWEAELTHDDDGIRIAIDKRISELATRYPKETMQLVQQIARYLTHELHREELKNPPHMMQGFYETKYDVNGDGILDAYEQGLQLQGAYMDGDTYHDINGDGVIDDAEAFLAEKEEHRIQHEEEQKEKQKQPRSRSNDEPER